MSTALAPAGTTALAHFPTPAEWDAIRSMGALLSQSPLVPQHFRGKPNDCVLVLLTGRELGLGPMLSLQNAYVIGGKFELNVATKLGVVQSRVPDFDYQVLENDETKCTVKGGRTGKEQHTVTFTVEQAQRAGLLDRAGSAWANYREDMLHNRALGRLLKRTCSAALVGLPLMLDDAETMEVASDAVTHEPSSATVVESAQPAAPQPEELRPTQVHALRFFALMPVHGWPVGGKLPDGAHKNAVTKFVKANERVICNCVSAMYSEMGTPRTIRQYVEIAPLDWEALVGAFEAWVAKKAAKAGNGADGPGHTDVPPASPAPSSAEVVLDDGADAEIPAAATPAAADPLPPPPHVLLANMGQEAIVAAMETLRHASKGTRKFYKPGPDGALWLTDGALLMDLGRTRLGEGDRQVPVAALISELCADEGTRLALCDLLCHIADLSNVSVV
jgi:hypothetical protein